MADLSYHAEQGTEYSHDRVIDLDVAGPWTKALLKKVSDWLSEWQPEKNPIDVAEIQPNNAILTERILAVLRRQHEHTAVLSHRSVAFWLARCKHHHEW